MSNLFVWSRSSKVSYISQLPINYSFGCHINQTPRTISNLWTCGEYDTDRINISAPVQRLHHLHDSISKSDLQWQQLFLGTAWAGLRSGSAPCWLETLLWCLPSKPCPSWLWRKMEKPGLQSRVIYDMKTGSLYHWLTCNIHFSSGQRSQVRRGECTETTSIHLGHTIPSVEFVVEIKAHLNREKDTFNVRHPLLNKNYILFTEQRNLCAWTCQLKVYQFVLSALL